MQVEQLDGQITSLENLANGTWVSEIKTFVLIDSKLSALFINLLMFSFSKGFDLKKVILRNDWFPHRCGTQLLPIWTSSLLRFDQILNLYRHVIKVVIKIHEVE